MNALEVGDDESNTGSGRWLPPLTTAPVVVDGEAATEEAEASALFFDIPVLGVACECEPSTLLGTPATTLEAMTGR